MAQKELAPSMAGLQHLFALARIGFTTSKSTVWQGPVRPTGRIVEELFIYQSRGLAGVRGIGFTQDKTGGNNNF